MLDVLSKTASARRAAAKKAPHARACIWLLIRGADAARTHKRSQKSCGSAARHPAHTKPPRTPSPPPRTRPARAHRAGASWVLTSLIREASLGVGLGVVFGAVWSTMQTGPVSKRIVEYYKNNPTQS